MRYTPSLSSINVNEEKRPKKRASKHTNRVPIALPSLVTAIVFIGFFYLNLDGYRVNDARSWSSLTTASSLPVRTWCHGWPAGGVLRLATYPKEMGPNFVSELENKSLQTIANSLNGVELGNYSVWAVDQSPWLTYSVPMLLMDILVGLTILVGAFFGSQILAESFGIQLQFQLKWMLFGIVVVAVLFSARNAFLARPKLLNDAAFGVVIVGCLLCVFWVHHLYLIMVNRLRRH